jgi:hypothetical protein
MFRSADLRDLLRDRACQGFALVHAEPTEFAQNTSGKIPLLYQVHLSE